MYADSFCDTALGASHLAGCPWALGRRFLQHRAGPRLLIPSFLRLSIRLFRHGPCNSHVRLEVTSHGRSVHGCGVPVGGR